MGYCDFDMQADVASTGMHLSWHILQVMVYHSMSG